MSKTPALGLEVLSCRPTRPKGDTFDKLQGSVPTIVPRCTRAIEESSEFALKPPKNRTSGGHRAGRMSSHNIKRGCVSRVELVEDLQKTGPSASHSDGSKA